MLGFWAGAGRGHVLFGGVTPDAQRWSRGNFRHDYDRGMALLSKVNLHPAINFRVYRSDSSPKLTSLYREFSMST